VVFHNSFIRSRCVRRDHPRKVLNIPPANVIG
jgi:hypothetical protein